MQHKPKPKVSDVDALMEPRGKKSMATTRTRKSKRQSKITDLKRSVEAKTSKKLAHMSSGARLARSNMEQPNLNALMAYGTQNSINGEEPDSNERSRDG